MISFAEFRPAPAPRSELRSDATQLAINALVASVGTTTARTWAAGAVECAAGLWARCMSAATVQPAGTPVGPRWLAETARDLARRGEVAALVDVTLDGRLRLLRATITDVWGDDPDPADWWYRLTLTGPHTTRTVTAPAAAVFHVRYATEPGRPARGVSPLEYASLTGSLTASLEQSLGYEAGGAVANLIALPSGFNAQPPTEDGIDQETPLPADTLAESIRTAKGRTLLPETTQDNYGDATARPPRRDFEPQRLGANPPMALITLRQQVECSVLACFGVPAPMGPMGVTDGTAQREAARRLWALTIQPLAKLIEEELSRVLERPIVLDYSGPSGQSDVAARARAVGVLVGAGATLPDALARAGWSDDDA